MVGVMIVVQHHALGVHMVGVMILVQHRCVSGGPESVRVDPSPRAHCMPSRREVRVRQRLGPPSLRAVRAGHHAASDEPFQDRLRW